MAEVPVRLVVVEQVRGPTVGVDGDRASDGGAYPAATAAGTVECGKVPPARGVPGLAQVAAASVVVEHVRRAAVHHRRTGPHRAFQTTVRAAVPIEGRTSPAAGDLPSLSQEVPPVGPEHV